jgi:hypothetical protein
MATNTPDALLARLKDRTATVTDMEDAVALLKRYAYRAVTPALYHLRDLLEDHFEEFPEVDAEVRELVRKGEMH